MGHASLHFTGAHAAVAVIGGETNGVDPAVLGLPAGAAAETPPGMRTKLATPVAVLTLFLTPFLLAFARLEPAP